MMLAATLAASSCDGVIYDGEGDCGVSYALRFRYDMNMKFADAFPHEVGSVAVYAFGADDGKLVWQRTESGAALSEEGYEMALDLPAGDYDLIAWCGLEATGSRADGSQATASQAPDGAATKAAADTKATANEATSAKADPQAAATRFVNTEQGTFAVPELTVGISTKEELTCRLNRLQAEDGEAYVDADLRPLWHGTLRVSLPDAADTGGDFVYVMPLTKDTNHLRVILQHLSGTPVDADRFTFTLEDANGLMASDNSLMEDGTVTYRAWNVESAEAGVDLTPDDASDAVTYVRCAIADLTTARLMEGRKVFLTIRNDSGKAVVRIPLVDYALLVKGYYNRDMADQEFLDRQDEWSMTFFLDDRDGERWKDAYIYINSWRVVLSNISL